ncbi:MAG TPA: thioredoxin family protein [Candidatus Saccharimonadales bacterium]|nr:thioredoxin family protein [Candidatus Saccharimonadales bacterium]
MQINKLFIFFLSISLTQNSSLLQAHPTTIPNPVGEITSEDKLHAALTSSTPTLVMGYMNNCSHCAMLKPAYEKLATEHRKIDFVKVNGQQHKMHNHVAQLTEGKKRIPGYPSIAFVKNGVITDLLIGGNRNQLEAKIAEFEKDLKSDWKKFKSNF